jgi:competence protein ComEC
MPIVHFLNVKTGDCSVIQHASGHVSVIDVCNAYAPNPYTELAKLVLSGRMAARGVPGDFKQKENPVNPISYLTDHGINDVFRFILTHPDMDHMDGIKAFFAAFSPTNFWDTDNCESKEFGQGSNGGFSEEDWNFYKKLRDGKPETDPKRLALCSGAKNKYYNVSEDGESGGDGLHVLAPTAALVREANECGDYNDCSYVLLYWTGKNRRILFGGDSHDKTWEHILKNHEADVKDVDLLIAPHHGRGSDRSYGFLDVLRPKLTLFGNADSEDLAYSAWSYRDLPIITNNQAGCVLADAEGDSITIYVTCKEFARESNARTFASQKYKGYHYWGTLAKKS